MLSLNALDWGYEIAQTLQRPTDTEVFTVRWANHHGNMHRANVAVCIKVDCEMPVFHQILHVVVKDDQLLLITFANSVSEGAFQCISSFVSKRRTSCCCCPRAFLLESIWCTRVIQSWWLQVLCWTMLLPVNTQRIKVSVHILMCDLFILPSFTLPILLMEVVTDPSHCCIFPLQYHNVVISFIFALVAVLN